MGLYITYHQYEDLSAIRIVLWNCSYAHKLTMAYVLCSYVFCSYVFCSYVFCSYVFCSYVLCSYVPIHYPAPSSGYSRVGCKLPTYEESCRCQNCKPEFGNPGSENKCETCVCHGAPHILRTCDCMGGCGPARDHTGLGHIECKNCLCLE